MLVEMRMLARIVGANVLTVTAPRSVSPFVVGDLQRLQVRGRDEVVHVGHDNRDADRMAERVLHRFSARPKLLSPKNAVPA
jgi:hypothetical protein